MSCTAVINLTYADGSEGSPSNPVKFKNQDFAELKNTWRRRGRLFMDPTFAPESRSLGDLPDLNSWEEAQVQWLRPAEILKAQGIAGEPVFCTNGASRFDFSQGAVGNCWFLAAISSLTFQKNLMVQVVPLEQSFDQYAGIFHFRFWRFGKWVDVVIDDYLPTINKRLLSVSSKSGNEFWGPLLEKAYAKVCGSYADLNSGIPSEAFKDFSGGVNMAYPLRAEHTVGHDDELWLSLKRATECMSMICSGTARKGDKLVNTVAHTGLVDAHAYSVTGVTEVEYYGSKVRLVRLMNPWGRQEWSRKWSDKSDMWKGVSSQDQDKRVNLENGEFWMDLEDFCHYFESLFICCENPNFLDGDVDCQWKCRLYEGTWNVPTSAGGNLSYSTFAKNPQYRVQVPDIGDWKEGDTNILLSLVQVPRQSQRAQIRSYPIGLTLFKLPEGTPTGRLPYMFFRRNMSVKTNQTYAYTRDMTEYHSLEPGEYVVIPSTMNPNMSGDFVLTIYSKAETKITPHDHDDDDDDDDHDHDHDHEEEKLVLPEIPTDKEEKEEETAEKKPLRDMFDRYSYQNELTAGQLQRLLNDNFSTGRDFGFSMDTCRSMMVVVDMDNKMTMTFSEFLVLWDKMNRFKGLFNECDVNNSGALSNAEVKKAVQEIGIEVTDQMVSLMMFRYADYSTMSVVNFISLMIRLEKMSFTFHEKAPGFEESLNFEEWAFMFLN